MKIKFKDQEEKKSVINGKTNLKKTETTPEQKKIFMHDDQPYLTRRENDRLRKCKKDIYDKNPEVAPYIKSGILYSKNSAGEYVEVDKYNIENQLFNKKNFR